MSAELILTSVAIEVGRVPDWTAAHAAVDAMDEVALANAVTDATGDSAASVDDDRAVAHRIVDDLREWLEETQLDGFTYQWRVRGLLLTVTGGSSWGDDPSPGFTVLSNAWCLPDAMAAAGFLPFEYEEVV